MPPILTRYVVAVKRKMRSSVPADWLDRLLEIDGVYLVGKRDMRAVTIDATAQGIERVSSELGEYLYIEREIPHRPA